MHGKRLEKVPPRFGHRLRTIRIRRGLTQEMLGQEIGVSHVQVSRWDRLKQPPKFATVEKLAKGLNCSATELLSFSARDGLDGKINFLTKTINEQKETINSLSQFLEEMRKQNELLANEKSKQGREKQDVIKLLKDVGIDSDVVKNAYRKSANSTHPDHGGRPEKFRKVQEAYEIIWPMFYGTDKPGIPK